MTSISIANSQDANLMAIGTQNGNITLMKLCDSLYQMEQNEKVSISNMLERETRKEKNLETAAKLAKLNEDKQSKMKKEDNKESQEEKINSSIKRTEDDF